MRARSPGTMSIPVFGLKVRVKGWERLLDKTGLLLLILACLVIMVTWLGFAVHSYVAAGEVEVQALEAEVASLKKANVQLYEDLSEAFGSEVVQAEASSRFYAPPGPYSWDFLPPR